MMILNDVLLAEALGQYGQRSIPGDKHSARVRDYLSTVGLGATDDDAWCSAFMAWLFKRIIGRSLGKANARSWARIDPPVFGTTVTDVALLELALPGDVVVLWRSSRKSWKGHVGLFVRSSRRHVWLLGGNQGGRVSIKRYPIKRILKIRRFSAEGCA